MSYAIRNDGKGWRAVGGPEDIGPDETYSEAQPPMPAASGDKIKAQIAAIEATQGRAVREAALGDATHLRAIEARIEELRAQL